MRSEIEIRAERDMLLEVVKDSGFRYDYERAVLEWIFVDGDEIEAVDSYGLSKENWDESPEYWVERYKEEIRQEIAAMGY